MRLDDSICLGGRWNGKDILGIRFDKKFIFPSDYLNVYTVEARYDMSPDIYYQECVFDYGQQTDWGDGSTEPDSSFHYYKESGIYTVITTGFLRTDEISYPVIISVDKLRDDIIDGSCLFENHKSSDQKKLALPNTSFMTNMNGMFYNCDNLIELDISSFVTNNVTDMGAMFADCRALTHLDISSFVTNNVTAMYRMFDRCWALTHLDLSNFDTSNVTDMNRMFRNCGALEYLDISNFDMSKVTNTDYMFEGSNLATLRLDYCDYDTIRKIITSSIFPSGLVNGETRKIYCKRENARDLVAPNSYWEFVYINDDQVIYNEPTKTLFVPESTIEVTEEQLTISEDSITYDADNENLNIN